MCSEIDVTWRNLDDALLIVPLYVSCGILDLFCYVYILYFSVSRVIGS